jgi:VanZ family protein
MLLFAVAGASFIGALDEWHQMFLPGRHAGWHDLAMDVIGSLLGAALLALAQQRLARAAGAHLVGK